MNRAMLSMRLDQLRADLMAIDQTLDTRTTPADIADLLRAIRHMKHNLERGDYSAAFEDKEIEMTRHKHADIAEAFGNGKRIQYKPNGEWVDWLLRRYPSFDDSTEWRIKPDEPALVDMYLWAITFNDGAIMQTAYYYQTEDAAKLGYVNVAGVLRLDHTKITVPKAGGEK